jgi:hypothetical protein
MSPEILQGASYQSIVEIRSIGCVIYEVITLNPPFSYSDFEYQQFIQKQKIPQINNPYYIAGLLKTVVQILSFEHSNRITFKELEKNHFFAQYIKMNPKSFPLQLNEALIDQPISKEEKYKKKIQNLKNEINKLTQIILDL